MTYPPGAYCEYAVGASALLIPASFTLTLGLLYTFLRRRISLVPIALRINQAALWGRTNLLRGPICACCLFTLLEQTNDY